MLNLHAVIYSLIQGGWLATPSTPPGSAPDNIKTHGSVSCGPRSRRVTPVSILTGRKRNFRTSVALCCLDETRRFLLWTLPPPSALHIPNLSDIASSVPEICDFKNWLSFFVFFSSYFSSSFRTLTKTAIKRERHIRSP